MSDLEWGQAGEGAAGGAMSGAAFGSAFGPWGTGIGAAAGGLMGFFGGLFGGGDERDEYQQQLQQLYSQYEQRAKMLQGPAAQAQQSSLIQNRGQLVNNLTEMSQGRGPSAAAGMMAQGVDQASRAATSMAAGAGGRGVNAGASMRNAMNTGAAMQMQNIQNTGIVRSQEQMHAYDALGNVIGQGIASDNQHNQFNASQENERRLAEAAHVLGISVQQLQTLTAGAGLASNGTGTSILAGGAQAVPGLLQFSQQYRQGQAQQQQQQQAAQIQSHEQRHGQQSYGPPPIPQNGGVTHPNGSSGPPPVGPMPWQPIWPKI